MDTVVPGGGAAPLWTEEGRGQQAVDWGQPRSGDRPDAAAAWAAALEHEARGLLNLVAIASRCEQRSADEGEREQWRREISKARGRLEGLYLAGLPRDFLKEASAEAGGAVRPYASTSPSGAAHDNQHATGRSDPLGA